jgi:hypothetical protein
LTFRSVLPAAPGLTAAIALGVSDVLAKVIIAARCDVLTMLWFAIELGPRKGHFPVF